MGIPANPLFPSLPNITSFNTSLALRFSLSFSFFAFIFSSFWFFNTTRSAFNLSKADVAEVFSLDVALNSLSLSSLNSPDSIIEFLNFSAFSRYFFSASSLSSALLYSSDSLYISSNFFIAVLSFALSSADNVFLNMLGSDGCLTSFPSLLIISCVAQSSP